MFRPVRQTLMPDGALEDTVWLLPVLLLVELVVRLLVSEVKKERWREACECVFLFDKLSVVCVAVPSRTQRHAWESGRSQDSSGFALGSGVLARSGAVWLVGSFAGTVFPLPGSR